VPECPDSGVSTGSCFLYLDPRAAPKFQSAVPDMGNPNRRASDIGFFNDFEREYSQFAAFASVDFDILENLTLTLGTRYYDIENSMAGANIGSFFCKVYLTGESGPCTGALYGYGDVTAPYGTNVSAQADNNNQVDGFRSRANLTWRINPDVMVYATWSEGYRAAGFNRGTGCGVADPVSGEDQWCFPQSYESDELVNIEAGWKTTFWGGRAQLNGAIYQETWENAQSGIFAPQLDFPNLQFFVNGPEYEVNGVEMNFVVAPLDGLTVAAAGSYNKGELTNSPQLISNNPDSPTFGQPLTESCLSFSNNVCTEVVSVANIFSEKGTEMANSPELQFNVRARYEWVWGDYNPYIGAAVQYQDESYSSATEVNRYLMPSWTTWDAAIGIGRNSWNAEFYAVNLSDENTSVYTTASQFIITEVPMRPRTMGLRLIYNFGGN
jgi:outer membrane receptor protein involved in Fe transport